MTNPKMREIGRLLKEEESRFVGYSEIEAKSHELGFGMSVRTLRFYIDEGILPPPKKVGKTPVYEEDWILNVLLAIHLMKTRLNRSLSEVRVILQRLHEDPAILADKLSVLYEDYVKGGSLKPVERDWLVEAFFGLLTGKFDRARNASEVRISELTRAIAQLGHWKTADSWEPPEAQRLRALLAEGDAQASLATGTVASVVASTEAPTTTIAAGRPTPAPSSDAPTPPPGELGVATPPPPTAPTPVVAVTPPAPPAPEPSRDAAVQLVEPGFLPPDAIPLERARALEETFVSRFDAAFEARSHVPSPLEGKVMSCDAPHRAHLQRDHASKVIELMKRNRVYDRALLDVMPLDEATEYHVSRTRFPFGRELKVVVAALALSPLEAFVTKRWAQAPLGPAEVERALSELVVQDDIFYYVGILSTTGWSKEACSAVPVRRNLLACLVEMVRDPRPSCSPWLRHFAADVRWGGLERLFDPETDREKVERVRTFLLDTPELKLKGGHVILKNVREDLAVPEDALRAAVAELCATDQELSVVEVGGREILKRRRI